MNRRRWFCLMLCLLAAVASTASGGETRWVVETVISGHVRTEHPLWTFKQFADLCTMAQLSGKAAEQKLYCETGFGGLKPTVGTLPVGVEVELLASTDCGRDMASVRVVTGRFKGETGCISSRALSSRKPGGESEERR